MHSDDPAELSRYKDPGIAWRSVPGDPTTPGPIQFDAMLRAGGFFESKPAVSPGLTGNNFYTVAPFQVGENCLLCVVFVNG